MQFIDIKAIHKQSASAIDAAVAGVFAHGKFINGPEVYDLEASLSNFLDCTHCVAVSSGTMALEIALRALKIGPGDEVITTPFTWISTAEAISLAGATPVFVDICADSYNLNPQKVEEAVTPKTRAILAVNLFGQMADYAALEPIAKAHDLFIVEDAAQSFGAEQNGRKSCTVGTVSCTSFFPAKPLGGYGDGGAIFTSDEQLGEDMRAITNHGGKVRESHHLLGTNGRCDTLQAAIINAKFPGFRDQEINLRKAVAQRYTEALKGYCQTPVTLEGNSHIFAQYTIRPKGRDKLQSALKAEGIPSAIYYRKCLHQQPVFSELACASKQFPEAEQATREVISLPFHPYLKESEQDRVIDVILKHEK